MRLFESLYPETAQEAQVLVANTGANADLLNVWMSGEVTERGITPGWSRGLRWWVERAGLTYRDPIAPDPTPVGPTTGQIWPR